MGKLRIGWLLLGICSLNICAMESDDSEIIQRLIRQANEARAHGFTQSEAHISVPSIQRKLREEQKNLALTNHGRVIQQALEREKQYKDYYVFYTSVPRMHLLQDVMRKLYKLIVGNQGMLQEHAFQFIRYLYMDHNKRNLSTNHEVRFEITKMQKYSTINQLLEEEMKKHGIIDDHLPMLKGLLISANCALFGNVGSTGECTWYFFVRGQPWAWDRKKLEKRLYLTFSSFGIPQLDQRRFVEKLSALNELLLTPEKTQVNDLFQIFIPKNIVNKIGYASWRLGLLFDITFINKLLENVKNQTPLDQIKYKKIREAVTAFRKKWEANNKLPYNSSEKDYGITLTVNLLLEKVRNGTFHLSSMLQEYIESPEKLSYINTRQARLLSGLLLDPSSGIRIYRYYRMDQQKLRTYRKKINTIFGDIKNYLDQHSDLILH